MKKVIFLITIFLINFYHGFAETNNLKDAIQKTTSYLADQIPARSTVAIINIEGEKMAYRLSDVVIEEITEYLVNNSTLRIVERSKLDPLMAEMEFGMSGYVDDESAQKIGHMLGAQVIISGNIRFLDQETLRLQIKATAVETAQIIGQRTETINTVNDKTLWKLMGYSPFKMKTGPEINFGFYMGGGPNNNNTFVLGVNSQIGYIFGASNALGFMILLDGGGGMGLPYLYDYYVGGLAGICLADGNFNIGLGGGISTGGIPYLRGMFSTHVLKILSLGLYFDYVMGKDSIEPGYKIGGIVQFRIMQL